MKDNIYEKKSVHSLILSFSIPAIFSLIVEILASVVDTAFAGHLGDISMDALTTMVVSVLVSLISYCKMERPLSFLGATGQIAILAEKYLNIQLWSNVFSAMGYTCTSCIRAFGYPKIEMLLTGFAVLVNIALNTIFVFCFDMGFVGLAYGTLVSECCCCFASIGWLVRHRLLWSRGRISCSTFGKCTVGLFKLGAAQTVIQSLAGCNAFFINQSLLLHTTLDSIAIWNVVQKIYTLFLMPIVGITQGMQTIIAYFDGHGEENKKKKALLTTISYTVIYGLLGMALILIFGKSILLLFADAGELYPLGQSILRIVFSTFPLMGIFYTMMTLYEVTGREGKAVFLILTRQVFLMIPLIYLMPKIFPEASFAIFWAVPLADIIALFVAVAIGGKEGGYKNCSQRR